MQANQISSFSSYTHKVIIHVGRKNNITIKTIVFVFFLNSSAILFSLLKLYNLPTLWVGSERRHLIGHHRCIVMMIGHFIDFQCRQNGTETVEPCFIVKSVFCNIAKFIPYTVKYRKTVLLHSQLQSSG